MKKILFVFLILLLFGETSFARMVCDYQSGNCYNIREDFSGNTHINGFNSGTGSYWQTDIKPNGNMRGIDKDGNFWNYNERTGSYFNSNGTTCYGKGIYRRCY